jgi:hypothetical protein
VIKSRIESFAKYAGIATVGVEWSALVLYYLRMPGYFGGQYPISYFATLPQTHVIFATCYVLAAICCWIFTKHHLGKHFRVPTNVFGVSLGLFAAMALFPVDFDNSLIFTVHSMFAYTGALLYVVGMYLMARRSQDRVLSRVTMTAIILSTALTAAFTVSPHGSRFIFAFEAGSWLMLQLWMIWVTF